MSPSLSLLDLVGSINCFLKVSQVIKAVKDSDDIDSVCDGLLNESINNVICIRSVSEDVLSSEEHLELGVLESVTKLSESLPGIFLEESE